MSDDHKLLELAAKAAGWTGWQSKHGYWNVESPEGEGSACCYHWKAYCPNTGEKLKEPTFADAIYETGWNPLTDDGDALRLAVKLRMDIEPWVHGDSACSRVLCQEILIDEPHYGDDPERATRRAIVRAAAAIGESM